MGLTEEQAWAVEHLATGEVTVARLRPTVARQLRELGLIDGRGLTAAGVTAADEVRKVRFREGVDTMRERVHQIRRVRQQRGLDD